jgi:hypothetical protein
MGAAEDPPTAAAAWRLLEAGDALSISQVEGVGVRMLLKRAHELAELQSPTGRALESIEDLAQLLALWKPGAYNKDREQAYFDARFAARERPSYPHPAMAAVLDRTFGQVLYAVMWTVSPSARRGRWAVGRWSAECLRANDEVSMEPAMLSLPYSCAPSGQLLQNPLHLVRVVSA